MPINRRDILSAIALLPMSAVVVFRPGGPSLAESPQPYRFMMSPLNLHHIHDVRDYRHEGDADDTAAVQRAIDAACGHRDR